MLTEFEAIQYVLWKKTLYIFIRENIPDLSSSQKFIVSDLDLFLETNKQKLLINENNSKKKQNRKKNKFLTQNRPRGGGIKTQHV